MRERSNATGLCCRVISVAMMLLAVPLIAEAQEGASASSGLTIRAAAISFVPVKFDLAGNADRLEQAFRSAHQGGAKIAVAPEGILEGYVVNEIIAGKAKAEMMKDVAVTLDDPMIRRFQNLARELEMCLVFGFAERIKDEVFNCAVFIDDTGRICGRHHKMQLAEGSHPDWWFNRLGQQSRAFDTPYGRCGIVICNERWNPQLARILALDGAQFLLIPSYGSNSKQQDDAVLQLGRENGVPVVEANVGVTLLVNDGRIAVVDRKDDGITFGDITIPSAIAAQPAERDRVEREFIDWREPEMKARYEKTMAQAKARPESASATGKRPHDIIQNSIGMKLVRLPAGEFTMGSPLNEKGRRADEAQHHVQLTRDFFIGQHEVTRGQFRMFVEATAYKTEPERGIRGGYGFDEATQKLAGPDHKYSWRFTGFTQTDEHPVVNVTWNDANAFCRWLNEKEKQVYRLPTEAEWEYACRGGTTTAYCNGNDPEKVIEVGNIMDALAHERFPDRITVTGRDGFVFTAPVGSFRPNDHGLHDMHGNVWEWTADDFGPPHPKDKVVRGGDWYHDWSFARSAQRYPIYPGLCRRHAGFRVVREM
ncbi:MAG: SUMF1/EgtB/PvdO family nonheme iron enzyme [Verrucomicrobiaceae bacterium]